MVTAELGQRRIDLAAVGSGRDQRRVDALRVDEQRHGVQQAHQENGDDQDQLVATCPVGDHVCLQK